MLILTSNEDRAGKALNPVVANSSVYDEQVRFVTGTGKPIELMRTAIDLSSSLAPKRCRQAPCGFSARAARIAAAYAETYLERGKDGRPDLKGRFYWMGLAAFASKQVKCGLDFIPSEPYLTLFTPLPAQPALRIAKDSLGKGNFWLFQDIYVWHWFYRKLPEQFDECAPTRNAKTCDGRMQLNVDSLPWAEEALASLNNLRATDFLMEGFKAIKEFEVETDKERQRGAQLESLLRIADHEQRKILQPLIYNDPYFQAALRLQAGTEWIPFMPQRVAAFSTACDVEDPELRVRMEEGHLFDEDDRMKFITAIAEKYHSLMAKKTDYMEGEIETIATWKSAT